MTEPDLDERPRWIPVSAGASSRTEEPIRVPRIFVQVIAGAIVVIIAVALVGIVAARRLAEAQAVNDAAKTADLVADTVVQPALTDGLVTGDQASMASLGEVIRNNVLTLPSIVRVKIWNPDGRILYSDEPRLIGQTFPLGEEERDVFADPQTKADVSDLQAPENQFERDSGKLLEAYRPVWTSTGTPMLFETYFRYDDVTARSGQLWRGFAGVTLSSILLLVVLLVPVLWRLLDRLKRAQSQREALLQRSVDASTEERKRIAGALHDGVVQDLVATSFRVTGSAQRAESVGQPALAQELRGAAGTVRTSIGGLRSLLVDIYPPNLAVSGLSAALDDLVSSVRSRGIAVTLDLPVDTGLDSAGERLVFRVSQECLGNVARHSNASSVVVRLTHENGYAVLDIVDDGVGFDADGALAHPPEGHFGLRVLGDVASEAGADLWLASAPGEGTRWRLRVPR